MRRGLPYAIIVPAIVVGFAVVLMIWAISGGSGARVASQGLALTTTGAAPFRPNDSAARSDRASDSARTIKAPENTTR